MNTVVRFARRHAPFFAGVSVAVVVCVAVVVLQGAWKDAAPGSTPPAIPLTRFALANGLNVIAHATAAPSVSLEMSYRVGAKDDPPDARGIAHLAEHVLMLRSRHVPRGFDDAVADAGGWGFNASTGADRTRFLISMPKGGLEAALWLEAERMTGVANTVTQETLDGARRVVLNELARNESSTETSFDDALRRAVFPVGHPYAVNPVGTRDSLAAITLEQMQRWLTLHYTPGNALLAVAGGIGDETQIRAQVEKYFGAIQPGQDASAWTGWIPDLPRASRYVTASHARDRLTLVWTVPGLQGPDLDRLDLLRHVLAPRLTAGLVNERSIAKAVRVEIRPQLLCSLFMIGVDLSKPDLEQSAIDRIDAELSGFAAHGIRAADLRAAREQVLSTFVPENVASGTSADQVARLSSGGAVFSPTADLNHVAQAISQARPDDVVGALERWLKNRTPVLIRETSSPGPRAADAGSSRITEMPPVVGAASALRSIGHRTLPNGLHVMTGPGVGSASAVAIVWPKPPRLSPKEDLLARVAIDALTESNPSAREAFRALKVGVAISNTHTHFGLGVEVPDASLVDGLTAVSRMIVDGAIDDGRVAAARRRWQRRLASQQPELWGAFAFRALQTLPQPTGLDRDPPPADWPTTADVVSWYDAQRSASRMALVIASDTSFETIEPHALTLLNALPAGNAAADTPAGSLRGETFVMEQARDDFAEVMVAVPLETHDPAVARMAVRAVDERVRQRLRGETQMSYQAFARAWVWRNEAMLYAYADTQPASLDKAVGVMEEAMRRPDLSGFCANTFVRLTARARAESQQPRTLQAVIEDLAERGLSHQFDRVDVSCDAVLRELQRLANPRTPLVRLVVGDRARVMSRLENVGLHPSLQVPPWWAALY